MHVPAKPRKTLFIVCSYNTLRNRILPSAGKPGESLRLREKAIVLLLYSKSECIFCDAIVPDL